MNLNLGLVAIFITLFIIIGAVATRRCVECMIVGSMVAAIFLGGTGFLTTWSESLQNMLAENVWVMLVCLLFGGLISLLTDSKGSFGFSKYISKFCNSEKKTLMTTFVMGILIFVDDYLNVLSIGACMKKISDKQKLPRESLAYILDSTGAPVCVLLPFSTWAVFYANLFYNETLVNSQFSSGMSAYIHAIPYCFYPFIALFIVFLFCMGWFPKLGQMKKAYQRVAETGMVYSEASKKYNMAEPVYTEDGNVWDFLIPIVLLVAVGIASGEILLGVLVAIVVCLILYVPRKLVSMEEFLNLMISGFGSMLSIFFMLVGAFSLANVCSGLGLTEYLIEIVKPFLSAGAFPALSFLLLAVLAFVTGSNWGMSAVVIPILIPMCAALNGNVILTMAAIISGGAFGSHACFYTDATVLSSNSAGIDNMEHALTQWPYVFISAALVGWYEH